MNLINYNYFVLTLTECAVEKPAVLSLLFFHILPVF